MNDSDLFTIMMFAVVWLYLAWQLTIAFTKGEVIGAQGHHVQHGQPSAISCDSGYQFDDIWWGNTISH